MRKEILALVASSVALVTLVARAQVGAVDSDRPHGEHEHDYEQENRQKYTCRMHPEVVMDYPGNCPKCGMKLVPIKESKRPTPINREQALNAQRRTKARCLTPMSTTRIARIK